MPKPTHIPTNFSDEDRTRLAKLVAGEWQGPEEWSVCTKHPTHTESHRWVWREGESIESADAYAMQQCELCAEEEQDDG